MTTGRRWRNHRMCTLTYIPREQGYILTHNRDERIDRPSSDGLQNSSSGKHTSYFPQDLEAMGSWIGFSDRGLAACILNGGDKPYTRKKNYRKSRGLVVLECLENSDPVEFYRSSDFNDIEPFTLIIRSGRTLYQLIHNDNNNDSLLELDHSKYHIWSSSTLYTDEVRQKREVWFRRWLQETNEYSAANIQHFHLNAGEGDQENDLVMSRWGFLRTLSITQIEIEGQKAIMHYHNLQKDHYDQREIVLVG